MSVVTLQSVCELIVDCPHSTAINEGIGYPLVRTPNIGKGRLIYAGMHRVSKEVYNQRNLRAIPQENDIIFAREATAGNVAIIRSGEKVCLGQRTVLIRPNPLLVSPDFLVYFLLAPKQQYNLLSSANGATVAHVNMPTIRNLKIELPPLPIQQRIASILSRYDDLIENYQQQIKLLEEAALRLYKEWFVDLHFPGYENTKIVDGVPEGWEFLPISSICEKIKAGGTPSRRKLGYWKPEKYRWVKTKELQDNWILDTEEYISEEGLNNSSAKLFPPKTILMAIYASPTLGRLGILHNMATCNQAALGLLVDEKKCSNYWLYLKLFELRDYFNSVARGAGQQNISADVVKNKEIICPNKQIMDAFTRITTPIFNNILSFTNQITLLTEARDRLLPKLMSGEIEV